MAENLTQKTLRGLKWSYASTISTAIMQIGYTAVMARLLNPSDFGLVAMSGVVLKFGQYFSQMGMGSAIIQKKELTKANISAAFTSSIILGLLFTILTFFLAPLAKYVFNNIEVVPIVKVMGLTFLINGFSLTALALIRRNLDFKHLAFAEITAYIIGYLFVGIGSALLGNGVWSLVFASLTQNAILAILTFLIIKHKVKLTFSWEHYKSLISFGSKVSIISFFEFLRANIDTIFIGNFFSAAALGYYNRGYRLINLPLNLLNSSFAKVIYPAFSNIQSDITKLKNNFLKLLTLLSQFLFPLSVITIIYAKFIVKIMLGPNWQNSIPIIQILAIPSALILIGNIAALICEALAELKIKIYITLLSLISIIILIFLLKQYGIIGIAISSGFGWSATFLGYMLFIKKKLNILSKSIFQAILPSIVSSVIIYIISFIFNVIPIISQTSNAIIMLLVVAINIFILLILTLFIPFYKLRQSIIEVIKLSNNRGSNYILKMFVDKSIAIKVKVFWNGYFKKDN